MQDRSETVTKVIEENNIPPLLKAFGKNIIPVPMKALSKVKNDFVVDASPWLLRSSGILAAPQKWPGLVRFTYGPRLLIFV
jgi:hypothetical protein